MDIRKRRYAKLLLECLKIENKDYLFVQIPTFLSDFKEILLEESKNFNLKEVYFYEIDPFKKKELIEYLDEENIYKHPMFNLSIFNKYAKLDAAFLFIDSMVPHLMDGIDEELLKRIKLHERKSQEYFRDLYEGNKLYWLIAGVPNEYWSNDLNLTLNELWEYIFKVTLIDSDNPYESWIKKLDESVKRADILNKYHFEYLKYRNKLGTDLTIYLPKLHKWGSGYGLDKSICNLPTEEIFTSPDYLKTDGIVYNTKPLLYNNILIDDFYIKFENGKVVDFNAKKGHDTLKSIIETDENSCYLGECALVSFNSPINNTNLIFKSTLYDENASCHLALGMGFIECLDIDNDIDYKDIPKYGVNTSKTHVDFMIGDDTLTIDGYTYDGKCIRIMENGDLII